MFKAVSIILLVLNLNFTLGKNIEIALPEVKCSNSICSDQADGSVSYLNGTCNQFIVCNGGCDVVMNCPNNLQYNLKTKQCDYPENIECPWQSTPPTTGPSGVTCDQPGKCVRQPDGKMFADSKSNGYIVCQCECEIVRPCPEGTKFDEKLQACANVNEGGNGNGNGNGNGSSPTPSVPTPSTPTTPKTTKPTTPKTTKPTTPTTPKTTKPTTPSTPPATGPSGVACEQQGKCAGQLDGTMFANPKTNGYIVCQCECEIARPCPAGTKFDEKLATCAHVNEGGNGSGNGNSPTPTPPTPSTPTTPKTTKPTTPTTPKTTKPTTPTTPKTTKPTTPSTPPATGPSGVACEQQGKCAGQLDGTMFANPKTNGYIVCQCECEIARPCPAGTKFDEKLATCAHVNEGGNGSGNGNSPTPTPPTPSTPTTPKTTKPTTPTTPKTTKPTTPTTPKTTKPTTPSTPPATGPSGVTCEQQGKCAGQLDGTMFANPKTNGYIVCQCECEIARPCPVGTKFDEKLVTCAHE